MSDVLDIWGNGDAYRTRVANVYKVCAEVLDASAHQIEQIRNGAGVDPAHRRTLLHQVAHLDGQARKYRDLSRYWRKLK